MNKEVEELAASLRFTDLHPALQEVVRQGGMDEKKLRVGLQVNSERKPFIEDVHRIMVTDGEKIGFWEVPSLRTLLRGDKVPPDFSREPPPPYMPLFFLIEDHALLFCGAAGDKTDAEFEEAYSNLRRRPDGKCLSPLHSFLWQVAAGLAGIRPVSAAEFDAIIGRLARSASHFRTGFVSRNYMETFRRFHPGASKG